MTNVIKKNIPNTVTCLNLFSGCIACVMSFEAKYELALLFIVPTLFIAFQWLQERLRPVQSRSTEDWQIEEEIKVSEEEKSKAGKK